jgi:citrate synthase
MTGAWLPLLAQAADPISGGAGWIGAGLLGAVLCWLLLKHLPDKDKQTREIIAEFREETKDVRESFQSMLNGVTTRCELETAALRVEMDAARKSYREESEAQRRAYVEILDRIAAKFEAEVAAVREAAGRDLEAVVRRIDGGRGRRAGPEGGGS